MQSLPRLGPFVVLLLTATVAWSIVLPPIWAHNLGTYSGWSYAERLGLYVPEIVVAVIVAVSLLFLSFRPRVAVVGFVVGAIAAPALKVAIGSPSEGTWPISLGLLGLLAWRLHAIFKSEA